MSKFGELIDVRIPVLLSFYAGWDEKTNAMHSVLIDVAASLGGKVKVVKIDVDKNQKLAEALRVQELPTLMIYWNGEMKWRESGEQSAKILIDLIQEYL